MLLKEYKSNVFSTSNLVHHNEIGNMSGEQKLAGQNLQV